jgi:hypothetical protein
VEEVRPKLLNSSKREKMNNPNMKMELTVKKEIKKIKQIKMTSCLEIIKMNQDMRTMKKDQMEAHRELNH